MDRDSFVNIYSENVRPGNCVVFAMMVYSKSHLQYEPNSVLADVQKLFGFSFLLW